MERQHNNGDFEKLLRDNANQYRMYPSEKVWNNIHSALHSRRRWYGISAAIMLLITSSIVSIIIYNGNNGRKGSPKTVIAQSAPATFATPKSIQQKYTPALSKGSPKSSVPGNVAELVRHQQAFDFTDSKTQAITYENNVQDTDERNLERFEISIPTSNQDSIVIPVYDNPNLLKYSNSIGTENFQPVFNLPENSDISETGLGQNKNKISETISALASQNADLPKAKKHARVTAQFYFTPTVSYRKLTENKKVFNRNGLFVPIIDVNSMVKHKPAMGLEFGIEGKYHINDRLSILTGLQFNINRYDIRAYSHTTEIATVALNSGNGFDSRATTTNFRNNYGGTDESWLENFYFQAATPVGLEYILSSNKNVQWGVSGTIQPTYVIGDRAYLISSDYKNYARFPDLMRRWNISSGVETFVAYSTGRIKWQVGPHVRYQHLSSFVSALTVKEKLFAVGLKVGATINKNK